MTNYNDRNVGCGCLIVFLVIILCINMCDNDDKKIKEQRIESSSLVDIHQRLEPQIDPIVEEYKDKRLETGDHPYDNEAVVRGSDSRIVVMTSGTDRTDVVVILKSNDLIVRNQYIQAGGQAVFNVPDGTYQIFFYYGKGWYPDKEMPNGMKGGFVLYESFSKDDPQYLKNNILTYELILQTNGNFSARPSNAEEVF